MASWIISLGYFSVFIIPLVESIGVPMPVTFAFLAGLAILESESANAITYAVVLGLLVLGQMGGSLIGFFLGRSGSKWFSERFAVSARFSKTYQTVQLIYDKWGVVAVIFARLCGYIRPWASLASGLMRMRFVPFLIATFIGSVIWTLVTFYLIKAGYKMYQAGGTSRLIVSAVLALAAIMVIAFWLRSGRKRK